MASPEEMAATMIANLKDKTGKTLPQCTQKKDVDAAVRNWLKQAYDAS
jgi:hypothetical protein